MAGHGGLISVAIEEVISLSEKSGIPISWTLLGSGAVPASHPLNMGMMGMHGEFAANNAIHNADLLIACGMRFDDRVTGNTKTYSPYSKKIHIEVDPSEINKNVRVDLAINGDLKFVLKNLLPKVKEKKNNAWYKQVSKWRDESASRDIINMDTEILYGAQVISDLWRETNGDAIIVSDVGQHQMLEAQYYKHDEPNTLLTSGGLGTMGFSLPAAIGAGFANRDKDIWVIVGDGSIQMTITELATAVQENSNIKIAIIDRATNIKKNSDKNSFIFSPYVNECPDYYTPLFSNQLGGNSALWNNKIYLMSEDEFKNGRSHVRAAIVGSSNVAIPIVESELLLGRWQKVFFVELDCARNRRFFVQIAK